MMTFAFIKNIIIVNAGGSLDAALSSSDLLLVRLIFSVCYYMYSSYDIFSLIK